MIKTIIVKSGIFILFMSGFAMNAQEQSVKPLRTENGVNVYEAPGVLNKITKKSDQEPVKRVTWSLNDLSLSELEERLYTIDEKIAKLVAEQGSGYEEQLDKYNQQKKLTEKRIEELKENE